MPVALTALQGTTEIRYYSRLISHRRARLSKNRCDVLPPFVVPNPLRFGMSTGSRDSFRNPSFALPSPAHCSISDPRTSHVWYSRYVQHSYHKSNPRAYRLKRLNSTVLGVYTTGLGRHNQGHLASYLAIKYGDTGLATIHDILHSTLDYCFRQL